MPVPTRQYYAVFLNIIAIRIVTWRRDVYPSSITLNFVNGRHWQFLESEGFSWDWDVSGGTLTIHGWNIELVQQVALTEGRVIPQETIQNYAAPANQNPEVLPATPQRCILIELRL